jgi:citronellol/citronellal dehydrogenase
MQPKWFENNTAYTMSKYGMSMIVMGLAEELKPYGIAANAIWPRTTIATSAVQNLLGGDEIMRRSRWPSIVAETAFHIVSKDPATFTGNFVIDEEFLRKEGVTDFEQYAVDPEAGLAPDIFVEL